MGTRKRAGLLAGALALPLAAVAAQPQASYELGGVRQPSAQEQEVFALMERSARARDNGRIDEAWTLAQQAVALARKTRWQDVEGNALLHLATVARYRGQPDAALGILRQAQLLCESIGNLVCQANVRLVTGQALRQSGAADEAQRQLAASRRLAQAAGDARGLLNADSEDLSQSTAATDRQARAEVLLARAQSQGSARDEALALRELGRAALDAGDAEKARQRLTQSLARARSTGDAQAESESLVALAELASVQRDVARAADLLARALAVAEHSGQPGTVGNVLVRQSANTLQAGDADTARSLASRALASFQGDGQVQGQGLAAQAVGDAEWVLGRREEAERRYREAIRLSRSAGAALNEAAAHEVLASLLRGADARAALGESEQAIALYERAQSRAGVASALLEQARIHGALGDFEAATTKAERSRALFEQLVRPDRVARADVVLAHAWRERRRLPQAQQAAGRAVAAYGTLGMHKEEAEARQLEASLRRQAGGGAP